MIYYFKKYFLMGMSGKSPPLLPAMPRHSILTVFPGAMRKHMELSGWHL